MLALGAIDSDNTSFLIGMLFWNYYLCATVDPGRVPESWVRGLLCDRAAYIALHHISNRTRALGMDMRSRSSQEIQDTVAAARSTNRKERITVNNVIGASSAQLHWDLSLF